jgi:hypothetical protein
MMIFLHVPKTGGTSFRFVLENSFGVSHCHTNHTRKPVFRQHDLNFVRRIFPGLRSIAGHNIINPLGLSVPDPFYMTMLREPISRVISHYQDGVLRRGKTEPFEQALRRSEELENLQVKLMAGERNLDKAKHFLEKCNLVGLTEKFDLSLELLGRLSPCKLNLNYKRKVVARDYSVRRSIQANAALMELAGEYNKLDLELYSFAVNQIFPKLCEQAGLSPSAQVPSYDTYTTEMQPKYQIGRFYNKVFRQICKVSLAGLPYLTVCSDSRFGL